MLNIFPFERKVVKYFLKDMGFDSPNVEELVSNTSILERDLDAVGFYATIRIKDFEVSLLKKSPWTGKVFGRQKNGTVIDLLIFKKGDLLMLEGSAFDSENYQGFEEDMQVFEARKSSDGSSDFSDISLPL